MSGFELSQMKVEGGRRRSWIKYILQRGAGSRRPIVAGAYLGGP